MAADAVEWGYEGPIGPERWASLSEAYAACGGEQQSPLDISGYETGGPGPIAFSYAGDASAVRNDGKAVHVDFEAGNTLRSGDRTYELASLHMHAPSEHRVEGAEFAAELHLVHADAAGDFAVVGLLFEPGEPNPIVQAILDAAPATGETVAGGIALNARTCVPSGTAYYAYDGSKTTPPCDEGVAWHVMRDPLTISQEQVNGLLAIGGGPTNRPIQPLGSRRIVLAGG
ncbi:MAG: carbonic anhydrase family protein [Chloroflexi bacterium]|nr:carbonic anhydrase family protein [Chloroflexota bacterium]